ncbi:hypothetical protein ACH5RR_008810 [Cinchona calisaya]|uniref:Maturase K n=1 Tax=Cinchona calisaya TaxID=153742 RepID=A0ABD3AHT0_9GENT
MDPNSLKMCQDEEMKVIPSVDSSLPRLEHIRSILIKLDWTIFNSSLHEIQFFKVKHIRSILTKLDWTIFNSLLHEVQFLKVKHKWRSFNCKKAGFLFKFILVWSLLCKAQ